MCTSKVAGVFQCGQCLECRLEYARKWSVRLMAEAQGKSCCFLTLTYDDEHLPESGSISKRAVQLFLKKLRKRVSCRYFAAGEYGDKYKRPHYHLALIGVPVDSPLFENRKWNSSCKVWHATMKEWPNGFVAVGNLTVDSANYIAGYMVKKVKGKKAKEHYAELGIEPEFALMSRKPGLGYDYLMQNYQFLRENGFMVFKGHKVTLPRFFYERLFTQEERKEMAELRQFDLYKTECRKWRDVDYVRKMYGEALQAQGRQKQRERNLKAKLSMKKRCLDD